MTGPTFGSPSKKLTCKFEHTETIGRVISVHVAFCPLPLFTRLGQHILWISDDTGGSFKFYAVMNIGKIPSFVRIYSFLTCWRDQTKLHTFILFGMSHYNYGTVQNKFTIGFR